MGAVRDILANAAPRRMGTVWLMNRESEQWKELANKRLFALSSACDKREFNPPIRRVTDSFVSALFHLAEKHDQIAEDHNKEAQNRFESFVNNSTHRNPSFIDFRNSKSFNVFDDNYNAAKRPSSTPTHEFLDEEYDDYELEPHASKRYRY